jgi:hypothetical protein
MVDRHCEEPISAFTRVFDALWGDEAIQSPNRGPGLLRFARNDAGIDLT